jgi:phosphonate transport system substrate-binding protein
MITMIYPRILSTVLLSLHVLATHAAEQKVGLEIGIAPFLPVKTLVQNYAPLRDYLQTQLKEPVFIVSAPDYKTYYQAVQKHEYPIIITAANTAYLAWADDKYIPLLQPINFTQPVVVITNSQTFKQLSDLRDKTISMTDATAIISMQGLQMLREAGLEAERDITIKHMQNHSAAVNLVIAGEATAAIVSNRALMQMAPAIREQVKIVFTWEKGSAPGVVYMASPDMPRDRREKIKKAILEFAQNTPEGKKLVTDFGYGGLQNIDPADLQALAPYGALLKSILANEKKSTDNK